MAFLTAKTAIKAKIDAAWPALYPTVPIFYQNAGLKLPQTPFVQCYITSEKETIMAFAGGRGRNEYANLGAVHTLFFVPLLSDPDYCERMRDDFANILRSQRFSEVTFYGIDPFGGDSHADKSLYFILQSIGQFDYRFKG